MQKYYQKYINQNYQWFNEEGADKEEYGTKILESQQSAHKKHELESNNDAKTDLIHI